MVHRLVAWLNTHNPLGSGAFRHVALTQLDLKLGTLRIQTMAAADACSDGCVCGFNRLPVQTGFTDDFLTMSSLLIMMFVPNSVTHQCLC